MAKQMDRRTYLRTSAAVVAAAAIAGPAAARTTSGQQIYLHGQAWNQSLSGQAGELLLVFDVWADIEASTGLGTASDAVFPSSNIHLEITSANAHGNIIELAGKVSRAADPDNVGKSVKIVAERLEATATRAEVTIDGQTFRGAGFMDGSVRFITDGTSNRK